MDDVSELGQSFFAPNNNDIGDLNCSDYQIDFKMNCNSEDESDL